VTGPPPQPLRVALVGCGRWGRHVLRDLRTLGATVPVVARSAASRARAVEGGAAAVVEDVRALGEVDGVVVATPTETHAAVVDDLLGLGVPLFVEKPLTSDLAAAESILARAGERVFVMHKWRYHPGIEALATLARTQELGEVHGVTCVRVGWGNPHMGVDAIWMLAPHDLSIVLEVLGRIPEPRSAVAAATGGRPTDLVAVLGDSPWATIEVSAAHPVRRREVRLVCQDGTAVLPDSFAETLLIYRGDPHIDLEPRSVEQRAISTELPLLRELRAFCEHLRGGPPPRSSAADGVAEVRALDALRTLAGLPADGEAGRVAR
jgi:predicted dehydrogenase